jgi:flagellar biosynthesis component FlhA
MCHASCFWWYDHAWITLFYSFKNKQKTLRAPLLLFLSVAVVVGFGCCWTLCCCWRFVQGAFLSVVALLPCFVEEQGATCRAWRSKKAKEQKRKKAKKQNESKKKAKKKQKRSKKKQKSKKVKAKKQIFAQNKRD